LWFASLLGYFVRTRKPIASNVFTRCSAISLYQSVFPSSPYALIPARGYAKKKKGMNIMFLPNSHQLNTQCGVLAMQRETSNITQYALHAEPIC
jgi:hypothetical protein